MREISVNCRPPVAGKNKLTDWQHRNWLVTTPIARWHRSGSVITGAAEVQVDRTRINTGWFNLQDRNWLGSQKRHYNNTNHRLSTYLDLQKPDWTNKKGQINMAVTVRFPTSSQSGFWHELLRNRVSLSIPTQLLSTGQKSLPIPSRCCVYPL